MLEPIYQSPIALTKDDLLYICQKIDLKGKNCGAKYNQDAKIFEIEDKIVLKVNSKLYSLVEYHFHVKGEHTINSHEYPSEIHYVFYEMEHQKDFKKCNGSDICGGHFPTNENILVIGRLIKNGKCDKNLFKLQVDLPETYFEYDGTLTGSAPEDNQTPVRWIVGSKYIKLPLKQIEKYTKTSKPIAPLNNRLILFSC